MEKKDYIRLIIIFLLCLVVVFFVTKFSNVFGSDTDWINQHVVFPDYLRNSFYETGDLIPNFTMNYGGGQNLYNISYYGLLSPLILPSYLMPHISMTTYITIVNIIVVFISIFLFYKWLKNNKYSDKTVFITTMLFAFSDSFIFQMHRHMMFVNYMPFLILALIGVDKLLDKNNKILFVISVFLMIMTSYYYSISGILVIGCYFIYKYFKKNKKFDKKDFIKKLMQIILLGLLGVLLSSILLLPTIYTLTVGRVTSNTSYRLVDLLIPYHKVHSIMSGTYAMGYQLIGFIAIVYLFYSKKKENIILGSLVSIILFIPIFRYLLNGGLYLREKCFIPFLPLVGMMIAYFINDLFKNRVKVNNFIIILLVINIPLYILNGFNKAYLYVFAIIILLFFYKKIKKKYIFEAFILVFAFVSCIIENNNEDKVLISDYNKYFSNTEKDTINSIISNDNGYYRISNLIYPIKTVNKIYNSKEYTTSFYSSTYNGDYLEFIRRVFNNNNPDFNYFFVSASDNPLFNTFMGVKYVYSDYDIGLGYDKVSDKVYINQNAFPIMYHNSNYLSSMVFDAIKYPYNIEILLNNTIVDDYHNNAKYSDNVEQINLDYEIVDLNKNNISIESNGNNNYLITVKENDHFKIKLSSPLKNKILFINLYGLNRNGCDNGNTYININNIKNLITCHSWIYHNQNETFHYVISGEEIDELNIDIGKGIYKISNIETFVLDYNTIKNSYNNLTRFNVKEIGNDLIKGHISVSEDGYFVTSIPYDKGFIVKVNGKNVSYEKVNKAFLGFELLKGDYDIEITYHTPWLKEGKLLSLLGLGILIGLIFFDKKRALKI